MIIKGDSLETLKTLDSESVNFFVTSPPYWGLRDYGVEGQLGLESTFQEYISKLCDIFDEVKRVLRPDGTCWVVIGDTYSGMKVGNTECYKNKSVVTNSFIKPKTHIKDKSLIQIPSRFAIEMSDRGWILRNEIIWYKPNCMPSSVKDRFTVDFEKVFFFVKNKKYWFEQQLEPTKTRDTLVRDRDKTKLNNVPGRSRMAGLKENNYKYKNKRCVWKVTTKPYKEAHFAVFPPDLVEPMIKAGCPEFICNECGKPREKIFERVGGPPRGSHHKNHDIRVNPQGRPDTDTKVYGSDLSEIYRKYGYPQNKLKGYTDCGCDKGFSPGIVLDPFAGSGTTGEVAIRLGRDFIGIELNDEYVKLAEKRMSDIQGQMF